MTNVWPGAKKASWESETTRYSPVNSWAATRHTPSSQVGVGTVWVYAGQVFPWHTLRGGFTEGDGPGAVGPHASAIPSAVGATQMRGLTGRPCRTQELLATQSRQEETRRPE